MRQIGHPTPANIPTCPAGHRPRLIETIGAPHGHRLGAPCPSQWHLECVLCGIATVPALEQSKALRAWRGKPDLFHIPISLLGAARLRIANTTHERVAHAHR